MQTTVGVNNPQAVKRWATSLATDTEKMMYFTRFIGTGENNIIERKVDLEEDAGDTIKFDLSMRLRGGMTFGDARIEGSEEALTFYQDQVSIDQARKAVSAGGRMTRKRTLHDYRTIAKARASEYAAEFLDELFFVYLSGDSAFTAINEDSKVKAPFAGNAITAPDADHILYGGAGTSKGTISSTDTMSVELIERVSVKPAMMNALNPNTVRMSPVMVDGGGKHFVLLMSPFQGHDLRSEVGDLSWSKIAQAAATSEGRKSPIFTGGLGMVNNVVLHEHSDVRRFNNYGVGNNIFAARALFMGRQAGVMANGSAGKSTRFSWVEKLLDADNEVAIYCGVICGVKKTTYNNTDFGVVAVDTAAVDPNGSGL